MKKYLLLLLCLPLLVTGCKRVPELQDGKQIVIELQGKQITAEDFFEELKEVNGADVLINLADKYIVEQELTDEMKEDAKKQSKSEFDYYYALYSNSNWSDFLSYYGFKSDDDFLKTLQENYEKNLVLEKYVGTTITNEEIEKYYNEDIYGEITARHILIKPEVTDKMTDDEKKKAKEEALEKAKNLISQLNKSEDLEKDFIELAKKESADTGTATEGGLIENFTNRTGLVTEFWEGSLKLEVGKLTTEPVETEYGYHIIYKVSQNEKPTLDTVRDTVIDDLAQKALSEENAYQVYFAGLREKYNLVIHDDTIKEAYDAAMKQYQK